MGSVHHRTRAGLEMEVVKASQHRFRARHRSQRVLGASGRLAGQCVRGGRAWLPTSWWLAWVAPVWTSRFVSAREPEGKVTILGSSRLLPRDLHRPQEAMPPLKVHRVGAASPDARRCRSRRYALIAVDTLTASVKQPVGLEGIPSGNHRSHQRDRQRFKTSEFSVVGSDPERGL